MGLNFFREPFLIVNLHYSLLRFLSTLPSLSLFTVYHPLELRFCDF